MAVEQEKTAQVLARLAAIADENELFAEIIKLSGCYFADGAASFGVWAPAVVPNQPLILNVAIPVNELEYTVAKYPMQRLVSDLTTGKDFFLLVLNDIAPYSGPGQGDLYFYSFSEREMVPDIYAFYQPFGVDGPSAVIDQQSYVWRTQKNGLRKPVSITKLHIGTASAAGDFAGLQAELDGNEYFSALDAVEFLPIGAFPGRGGCTPVLKDGRLNLTEVSDQKPINWGYDGGPSFILSVSEAYGMPDQLKSLVDAVRERGLALGFDIQFNHFGPESVYQSYYCPEYISQENTEWGLRPNFKNKYARRFMLEKLKEFCLLYRPDYLRLDMSSRYGDDQFIADICHLLPDLAVVLEDERQKPWLTEVNGAGALARWSFPAVHELQKLRAGDQTILPQLLNDITAAKTSVVFASSHDEQGNNDACPVLDCLTPALATMTNGIEMNWYCFGWFHFFCNYRDDIQLVMVTAEKSGAIRHYPPELWPKMTALYPYFQDFRTAQEFYNFIHHLWRAEVAPYQNDLTKRRYNVQVWINNNEMLIALCLAFNQMIFELANIRNSVAGREYLEFISGLKKIRKAHRWMHGADCYYNIDRTQNMLSVINIDPATKTTVKLECTLGIDESVKVYEN